jgi:hypothetical protein
VTKPPGVPCSVDYAVLFLDMASLIVFEPMPARGLTSFSSNYYDLSMFEGYLFLLFMVIPPKSLDPVAAAIAPVGIFISSSY